MSLMIKNYYSNSNQEIYIKTYSEYIGEYNFDEINLSSLISKLIYITAKLTENYASDIIYDIEYINEMIESKKDFDIILGFMENGVHKYAYEEIKNETYKNSIIIQYWQVKYNHLDGVYLRRVSVFPN